MDVANSFNTVAVVVSVVALSVSLWAARRQLGFARAANVLPVVIDAFQQTRAPSFIEARAYIHDSLRAEHDPSLGISALPPAVAHRIFGVGAFYDDLGKLVAHGAIDEDLVVGAYGTGLANTWYILKPYILAERERLQANVLIYFEHLAKLIAEKPSSHIYLKIGLKSDYREYRVDGV